MTSDQRPQPLVGTTPSLDTLLGQVPILAGEIAKGAAQRDLERDLPFAAFALIRESGLGALRIPRHLGGPGGSVADYIDMITHLAAADPNVAHALRSHFNFSEALVLSRDVEAQRTWLPKIIDGALFAGAHTEKDTLRPGQLTTTLRRAGNSYRLNGRKWYATGSAFADYLSFSAVDEAGATVSVLLPAGRAGIRVLDDWDGMGQRLTASGGVELIDVEVLPDEIRSHWLPDPHIARHASTLRQLHLAACAAGVVRNILADVLDYVRDHARSAAHSPAERARDDLFVQQIVGEIAANSHAIDGLVSITARTLERSARALAADDQEPQTVDRLLIGASLSNAKTQLVVGKLALRAAEILFESGGGSATSRVYNFDRHWRNIRTLLNHNPLLHKSRVVGDFHLNGETRHLKEGLVF